MAAIYSDLEGKVVLVTGGGSGIGAAIVRRFAGQKCKVGFIDIAREASEALAAELSATGAAVHFEHADLKDIAALRAAVAKISERFGAVDHLPQRAGAAVEHTRGVPAGDHQRQRQQDHDRDQLAGGGARVVA